MFEKEYAGICAICFEPVKNGQEYRYREKGRTFHFNCVQQRPNSYYAKKERSLKEK